MFKQKQNSKQNNEINNLLKLELQYVQLKSGKYKVIDMVIDQSIELTGQPLCGASVVDEGKIERTANM